MTDQRAAVVTGASSGIGEACALHLDALGWRVFAGVRRPEDAERLAAAGSDRLVPTTIDVTDAGSIKAASSQVGEAVGEAGLAGLVNNAGITVPAPLELLPIEAFRHQLEVNVVGQLAVTQAFLPLIRRARGRIVFVGSVGGRVTAPFLGAYGASKFAIEAITDALRQELRPWGIGVSVVEPGAIATAIWEKGQAAGDAFEAGLTPAQRERYRELYGRTGDAIRVTAAETADRGLPPSTVAKAIATALTARRPRPRRLIGRDAIAQVALGKLLPTRASDRVIARVMGLD